MSDLTDQPAKSPKVSKIPPVFLLAGIMVVIFLINYWVVNKLQHPRFESEYSSLFKTPLTDVKLSDFSVNHGHNHFGVQAVSGNLVLREDRNFRRIDCQNSPFVPNDKFWISVCYYQPHDLYLTDPNEDVWVYTDSALSQAFVVEDDHFYRDTSVGKFEPVFSEVFRNSKNSVNRPDYYERGNYVYFEIVSPTNGAPVAPKLLLQDSLSFKEIDPNPVIRSDNFPPRQKEARWMTTCFYHAPSGTSPADQREIWVFFNETKSHAFVICENKQ